MAKTENKRLLGLSVFIAIVGVGLVVTAVASDHWVNSELNGDSVVTQDHYQTVTFGLFNGEGEYLRGVGKRPLTVELKCETSEGVCGYNKLSKDMLEDKFELQVQNYVNGTGDPQDYGLFSFGYFVTTLVMLCLSMVFGLVTIGFTVFNVFGRPIETIAGRSGLYIWNSLALIFTAVAIIVYVVLFYTQLNDMVRNMLLFTDIDTWTNDTTFDYSFFCVVGAAAAYIINIIFLALSGNKCSCNYMASGEKEVDNGMILY